MKGLRITPINIACAAFLAWCLWKAMLITPAWKQLLGQIGFLLILIIADQFFRLSLRVLRRIWVGELIFLALVMGLVWVVG